MSTDRKTKLNHLIEKMKAFLTSRDALIFLFFLVCSFLCWLIMSLNKTYEQQVSIPIEYVNIPPEIELTSQLPTSFDVKLKDKGTTLLSYTHKDFEPVIINFNDFAIYSNASSNSFSIPTATHFERFIKQQINQSSLIIDYYPDQIVIEKSVLESKKVKVIPQISLNLSKQYYQCDDIIATPDSVTLYGFKEILDSLDNVYTEKYTSKPLSDTLIEKVSLLLPEHCKSKPSNINICVPVEFYTESNINVSISVKNLPENMKVKTIPEELNVSFLVGLSKYKNIRPSDFILSLDYEVLRKSSSTEEIVTLDSYPSYIKNPYLKNNKVKWIIEFVN